ncbi:hypothetical protein D0868_10614 [Hortaea werneckii]|uniref:IgE-binding protein n=1 Tax=Hortaea werneckii TaxID=91943 RepID=A0A3M6Y3A6_HORWE|nr:hypothetical protein D0868_10614 [Hortaea werneckii]
MKFTSTPAAAAGVVATAQAQYFSVISARSASPIHLRPLQARNYGIWIGGEAATYCPEVAAPSCPNTTYTNFAGGEGSLFMGTEVPGGQEVYIDPEAGALSYTRPHSAAMPEGAIRTGWSLDFLSSYGTLAYEGGLVACNQTADEYQVYAVTNGTSPPGDCLGFDALTSNQTKPAAWEYI